MSLLSSIKAECALSTTFERGVSLVTHDGVLSCVASPGAVAGSVRLSGLVTASHGAPYSPCVTLDMDDRSVVSYDCDCAAAASYDGMCKHACALALRYLAEIGDPELAGAGRGGSGGARRPARARAPLPSDGRISSLLRAITSQQLESAAEAQRARAARHADEADRPEEPVSLQVTISPAVGYYARGDAWLLKLRVHRGKASYVVKNVNQLVRTWRSGETVSYGKNLSFTHVPSSFTPRARQLLEAVTRIARSQQALFESRDKYQQVGNGTDIKELPLAAADVIEILDIMDGEEVTYVPLGLGVAYEREPARTVRVTPGNPRVEARLTASGTEDGGFALALPASLECFSAGDRLYLIDDDHAWRCDEAFSRATGALFAALLPTSGRALRIAPGDVESFCRTALPVLRDHCDLVAPDELAAVQPPEARFSFFVGEEAGEVFCRATVAYGDATLPLFEPARPGQPSRDVVAETRAQDAVDAYFPEGLDEPYFDEDDAELMYRLLTEGLRELSDLGEVMLSERLRGVEVRESPQVHVRALVKSGLLDLQVDASGLAPADLVAYLASYRRRQRYVRLSSGDVMRLDESVRAVADLADGLGVDDAQLVGGVDGLPGSRTLFVDALLRRAEGVRLERDAGFRAIVRDFDAYADADVDVPASLAGVLRPYQEEGFRWLQTLERLGFGGIIADDMGLGKTLQMITHVLACHEAAAQAAQATDAPAAADPSVAPKAPDATTPPGAPETTLVVCPASLVYNWMAELARFAPQLDAVAVLGGKAARGALIDAARNHDVLVTSYDLMKRDVEAYARQHFRRVILDEAQYVKNASTQVAKAAKCLPSDVRFALTGTPVENRLSELWSIFDFLMPGMLGDRSAFEKRYEAPAAGGDEGAAERLRCLVAPFILRRLKGDVLRDLPEKNESVVYARMSGEQEKLYKANQDRLALQVAHELPAAFGKERLQVLAELTKLRQICCDPRLFYEDYAGGSAKLDICLELVRNAVDGGHQVLVFSQFTRMLDLIAERLASEGIAHLMLTGATSKERRAALVAQFQAGEAPVFLISLKAGGVGLNLTAADVVVHYDPWWNLAAENQATDRAHRIGQSRAVSVFRLIAKDTIEERIVTMQQSKRDLAESVLGGEATGSASLTREDVLALLDARDEGMRA